MPPNTDSVHHRTSFNFRYPTEEKSSLKSGDVWLDNKRDNDGAEGLWRVHDDLYDFTDFFDKHPGGKMWLEMTKGTDITEAFESHHITNTPRELLKKHLIRPAQTSRNSPFTFEENGFYRTLKRNAVPVVKNVPKLERNKSDYIIDSLLIGTFAFAILAVSFWSYLFGVVSGFLLSCTTIAAHNYFHRKDNFRMYYFNLSMMQFREWRITHALSHHQFPNTIVDMEITFGHPLIDYLPTKKSFILKYGSWVYIFVIWATLFFNFFIIKFARYIKDGETRQLHWSDILTFSLPLSMYLLGGQPLLPTIGMWLFIITMGSLFFSIVGFNAAHHAPDIFHDGDTPRSKTKLDWGIHQLDTLSERHDIKGSLFLVLTNFGDHSLHHLFPTLDHSMLDHLYPVLYETLKQFDLDLRMRSQMDLVKGQFLQLSRETPNPNPPKVLN